jgi:hypothetical protein
MTSRRPALSPARTDARRPRAVRTRDRGPLGDLDPRQTLAQGNDWLRRGRVHADRLEQGYRPPGKHRPKGCIRRPERADRVPVTVGAL